jgi:ribosome-interacting GTPase 1
MPTNLPAEALAARQRYEEANSLDERVKTLQEYLSLIPKHKGSDKLRLILRGRLARLEEEQATVERRKKKLGSAGKSPWSIEHQGAGVAVLIGETNTGKSALIDALTGANVQIAEYPFTTAIPEVGATKFEDCLITIVELPAIVKGSAEGKNNGRRIMGIIRNAHVIGIIVDLSRNPQNQLELIFQELERSRIRINEEPPPVRVVRTGQGGIQLFSGELFDGPIDDLKSFLHESGIINATVHLDGPVTLDDVASVIGVNIAYKKGVIIGTKGDLQGSAEAYEGLLKQWSPRFQIIGVSVDKMMGLDEIRKAFFQGMKVIRVYTKEPGQEPSIDPLILIEGHTIRDLAKLIHKSFIANFRYARVTGTSVKHDGSKVGIDHILQDKDIVEIRIN